MMDRRNFLMHSGAVSLAGIAATLGSIQSVQAADYKALVVVFLSGGHDGNNILVPLDAAYNDYAKARPSLALPALATGSVFRGAATMRELATVPFTLPSFTVRPAT